jgi:hypothetical protein
VHCTAIHAAGDSTTDVRLLADNHLVLATPQQWDLRITLHQLCSLLPASAASAAAAGAGDSTTDVRLLADNHLVLATPQQWDMLSRRWKQRKAVQAVNLFIMDEMQLLGGQQGPTMEVGRA